MKKFITITAIFLIVITESRGQKQVINDDFITIDVRKRYPKKELILQDFMDVEYIVLDNADEFVCQGIVLAVGKEIIFVRNEINDGDIFIFDRKGKGIRKINRRGQGPEDYTRIYEIIPDEDNNEMFVNDPRGIIVYDLYGKYVRSFRKNEGSNYMFLQNFNSEYLICRETTLDINDKSTESQPFAIISKKDGSIYKDIRIRFKQGKNARVGVGVNNGVPVSVAPRVNSIIPLRDNWILTELSNDTVFNLLPDFSMVPFLVRTPSIQSMNPEVFLYPGIHTDRYYFIETLKAEFDYKTNKGFPTTQLMYDTQEKTLYESIVYNSDYSNKKTVDMSKANKNNDIAFWHKLEAFELIDSYKKGELKGKLKEVAEGLDEDSNPVIMLVKYKK